MAAKDTTKIGYGNYENISTAIENGTLDEKDIVITKDTSELAYIRDDKSVQIIKSRLLRFNSLEEANTKLNKSSDTYAGQIINIQNSGDGKYYPYVVQQGESSFVAEPVITTVSGGMTWTEF